MRPDGRKNDEPRKMEAKVGIIPRATGSAYFKIGNTIAIAAVYGPRELHPKHLQDPEKAVLRTYYDMMSFSVPERKRPGPDRRSIELSTVIREALTPVINLEEYPRTAIDVFINILQADAGTRCAAITAASMALADAGITMYDLVPAIAVGRVNGEIVLDLTKEEEDVEGTTDIPMAYIPGMKKITLLQLDGGIPKEDLKKAIKLGIKGCLQVYEVQKKALLEKYKVIR